MLVFAWFGGLTYPQVINASYPQKSTVYLYSSYNLCISENVDFKGAGSDSKTIYSRGAVGLFKYISRPGILDV